MFLGNFFLTSASNWRWSAGCIFSHLLMSHVSCIFLHILTRHISGSQTPFVMLFVFVSITSSCNFDLRQNTNLGLSSWRLAFRMWATEKKKKIVIRMMHTTNHVLQVSLLKLFRPACVLHKKHHRCKSEMSFFWVRRAAVEVFNFDAF